MELKEMRDLLISAIALAFIFSYKGIERPEAVIKDFPIALFAVSLGFLLHEMGHRYTAKKFGFHAEYRIWKEGFLIAIVITLLSNGLFAFAALGAVVIFPKANVWGYSTVATKRSMGLISISGPLMNFIISGIFLVSYLIFPHYAFLLGISINIWLALFNLIPIPPLDGQKIMEWNVKIWVIMLAIALAGFAATLYFF